MLPPLVLCWVGIPLLRFHLHPSQCRSIGQAIGLTAYPPQRAAIFTMPPHSNLPAYFRLGALFEVSDISTTSEPTVPSGIVSFGPADPVCARHLSCKGSLTPRPEVGSSRSPSYGQPSPSGDDWGQVLRQQDYQGGAAPRPQQCKHFELHCQLDVEQTHPNGASPKTPNVRQCKQGCRFHIKRSRLSKQVILLRRASCSVCPPQSSGCYIAATD